VNVKPLHFFFSQCRYALVPNNNNNNKKHIGADLMTNVSKGQYLYGPRHRLVRGMAVWFVAAPFRGGFAKGAK